MTSTDPAIAVARLRSLAPVSELTQSAFRDLLGQTSFRAFRGGARIYGQGESDDWTLFLLDGSVALEQGERRTELRSGQGAAQGPLSTGQQRNDSARAISDCTIAQVPTSLLTMLIEECRPSVAAISYQLARVLGGFSPDRALLSGLVHDIGALPVLAVIESHSQSANLSPEGLTACINGLQGQVGAMVLRHWAFPDDLVTVALEAEDWERAAKPTGSHGEADYCDLVLIAQLFSFMGTPHIAKYPSISAVPAFGRLMLGKLSPEETLTTLDDARHDIEDLKRMISN